MFRLKRSPATASHSRLHGLLWTCLAAVLTSTPAWSNPTGPEVVHGSAAFSSPGGSVLEITNAPGTIIHWQGFSIGADEVTRFIQQGIDSAVLNRVTGGEASALLGQLLSNGQVFLINPSGIVVGPGALIDTAGFVASTLDMSDADFLSRRMNFEGQGAGSVVNHGLIIARQGGDVALVAPEVVNTGQVISEGGSIVLAAGDRVRLGRDGLDGVAFEFRSGDGEVRNLGELLADNGSIGLFARQLEHHGHVQADRMVRDADGTVRLQADGDALVTGSISVAGHGTSGGSVRIGGDDVRLAGARIDASGDTGGGEVWIGGGYMGQGMPAARTTHIDDGSQVRADARFRGDGGEIVVWSEVRTDTHGVLSARGGPLAGDGGLVETSSRGILEFSRAADVSAPAGRPGMWLLDPEDIDIDAGKAAAIEDALNEGSSVTVKTADGGEGEGNITVSSPITKTDGGPATLTLDAHNRIDVNAPIRSESDRLDVRLIAGSEININATISTNGGAVFSSVTGATASADSTPASKGDADPVVATTDDSDAVPVADENESGAGGGEALAQDPQQEGTQEPGQEGADPNGTDRLAITRINDDVISLGGAITIEGGSDGDVHILGRLDASDETEGGTGGDITITGNRIALLGEAAVDASGSSGGGTVRIGGDVQGGGELQSAASLHVGADTRIRADALESGDGGSIVLFADDAARVYGRISARGGPGGGDGGFVETSGRRWFDIRTAPDVSAPAGLAGTWLIDPVDIYIVDCGVPSNCPGPQPEISGVDGLFEPPPGVDPTAQLDVNLIRDALEGGASVVVTTVPTEGDGNTGAGNIVFQTGIALDDTHSGTLEFHALGDILSVGAFGSVISGVGDGITSLLLNAFGSIALGQDIVLTVAEITLNAGGDIKHSGDVITGGESIVMRAGLGGEPGLGFLSLGGSQVEAGAGAISPSIVELEATLDVTLGLGALIVAPYEVKILAGRDIQLAGSSSVGHQNASPLIAYLSAGRDVEIVGESSVLAVDEVKIKAGDDIRVEESFVGSIQTFPEEAVPQAVDMEAGRDVHVVEGAWVVADELIRIEAGNDIWLDASTVWAGRTTDTGEWIHLIADNDIHVVASQVRHDDGSIEIRAEDGDVALSGGVGINSSTRIESTEQTIRAANLLVQGGQGDGSHVLLLAEGTQEIVVSEGLVIQAGAGDGAHAEVEAEGAQEVEVGGDLNILGGDGDFSRASLLALGGQDIQVGGSIGIQGGAGLFSSVVLTAADTQVLDVSGLFRVEGGDGDDAFASVWGTGQHIAAGSMEIIGGMGSHSHATVGALGGFQDIDVGGDMAIDAGDGPDTRAEVLMSVAFPDVPPANPEAVLGSQSIRVGGAFKVQGAPGDSESARILALWAPGEGPPDPAPVESVSSLVVQEVVAGDIAMSHGTIRSVGTQAVEAGTAPDSLLTGDLTFVGSSVLDAGGDQRLVAFGELSLTGSSVSSEDGPIRMTAEQGSIRILDSSVAIDVPAGDAWIRLAAGGDVEIRNSTVSGPADVQIEADDDVEIGTGSSVVGGGRVTADAGRDVRVLGGSLVGAGTRLRVDAGRDITVDGSTLASTNSARFRAGRDMSVLGGPALVISDTGNVTLNIGRTLTVRGGAAAGASAVVSAADTLDVNAAELVLRHGTGSTAFAQLRGAVGGGTSTVQIDLGSGTAAFWTSGAPAIPLIVDGNGTGFVSLQYGNALCNGVPCGPPELNPAISAARICHPGPLCFPLPPAVAVDTPIAAPAELLDEPVPGSPQSSIVNELLALLQQTDTTVRAAGTASGDDDEERTSEGLLLCVI